MFSLFFDYGKESKNRKDQMLLSTPEIILQGTVFQKGLQCPAGTNMHGREKKLSSAQQAVPGQVPDGANMQA